MWNLSGKKAETMTPPPAAKSIIWSEESPPVLKEFPMNPERVVEMKVESMYCSFWRVVKEPSWGSMSKAKPTMNTPAEASIP